MSEARKIVILPGDGIGPEIIAEGEKILNAVNQKHNLGLTTQRCIFGGAAYDEQGTPLPETTLQACRDADAILLGAIGGPKYDSAPRDLRPERGLLGLRAELKLFANMRPALLYPELADASSLKHELVAGLDLMILRELTGGIYFGQPRGIEERDGERVGFNTMVYSESEIRRIAIRAFEIARQRVDALAGVTLKLSTFSAVDGPCGCGRGRVLKAAHQRIFVRRHVLDHRHFDATYGFVFSGLYHVDKGVERHIRVFLTHPHDAGGRGSGRRRYGGRTRHRSAGNRQAGSAGS